MQFTYHTHKLVFKLKITTRKKKSYQAFNHTTHVQPCLSQWNPRDSTDTLQLEPVASPRKKEQVRDIFLFLCVFSTLTYIPLLCSSIAQIHLFIHAFYTLLINLIGKFGWGTTSDESTAPTAVDSKDPNYEEEDDVCTSKNVRYCKKDRAWEEMKEKGMKEEGVMKEGCEEGGLWGRRAVRKEGCEKGGLWGRRAVRKEGCEEGGLWGRRAVRKEGCEEGGAREKRAWWQILTLPQILEVDTTESTPETGAISEAK
jgi:hypothetical protein